MKRAMVGALCAATLTFVLMFVRHSQREHRVLKSHAETAPLLTALSTAKQPPSAIASVTQACETDDGCRCTEIAARGALDADLHDLATHALDQAPHGCRNENMLLGERAEAQARASTAGPAQEAAERALKTNAANPYAELALAQIAYDKNQMANCSDYAAKALQSGRGVEAERWLGRSALARGRFDEAELHFRHLLEANPNDAEAAFTGAICNDNLGHYREAREGFLQTLRINPKHELARFYLVVLTHKAGADQEARHHLQKLAEVLPKDSPKLLELEAMLASGDRDGGAPSTAPVTSANGRVVIQGKP
jgi:tetratricopeptide (TPR) repeat protein